MALFVAVGRCRSSHPTALLFGIGPFSGTLVVRPFRLCLPVCGYIYGVVESLNADLLHCTGVRLLLEAGNQVYQASRVE